MRIINWCAGGLGNRLKPLGSCALMAEATGRELNIHWKPALRCLAKFEDIYANDIPQVDLATIDLDSVSLYSDESYVHHEVNLNGNTELLRIMNVFGCKHFTTFDSIRTDSAETVVVYNNTTCDGYDGISVFLKTLTPINSITSKIESFVQENSISKDVIGVHARGTDFNLDVSYYIDQMHRLDQNKRIFVCSDSMEFETRIFSTFGPRIITRQQKAYVSKANIGGWTNNVNTPIESVQDSAVDLGILAKTDFQIFHPNSTFAHIAKYLA